MVSNASSVLCSYNVRDGGTPPMRFTFRVWDWLHPPLRHDDHWDMSEMVPFDDKRETQVIDQHWLMRLQAGHGRLLHI